MKDFKLLTPKTDNVPWQEKPEHLEGAPIWRYSENPVIGPKSCGRGGADIQQCRYAL